MCVDVVCVCVCDRPNKSRGGQETLCLLSFLCFLPPLFPVRSSSLCLSDYLRAGQASVCARVGVCVSLGRLRLPPSVSATVRHQHCVNGCWHAAGEREQDRWQCCPLSETHSHVLSIQLTTHTANFLMLQSSWCQELLQSFTFLMLSYYFLYMSACPLFLCKYVYHKAESCGEYWLAAPKPSLHCSCHWKQTTASWSYVKKKMIIDFVDLIFLYITAALTGFTTEVREFINALNNKHI